MQLPAVFCKQFSLPVLLFISFFISLQVAQAQADTVRVENGLIAGIRGTDSTVLAFKGIPYAVPPVGDLRWRAPQPAADWQDVYKANSFAPACMQIPPPEGSFYQVEFYTEQEPLSEDCLYLNVWTRDDSTDKQKPVMIWIHGGAFAQGSGSMPTFNGEAFAKKGVVLVTINYRLGIFGLFAHPELTSEADYKASGNYGLLDQVAALKWIQKNISKFGGDPDNVTIFGQSSGAGNINKLLASPMAKGLFHRAILQSGSAYTFGRTQSLEQAEMPGKKFFEKYKINSIEELRRWSAKELLEKSRGFPFMPNIDGWLLQEDVPAVFSKGAQHKVPILAGSVADEGNTLFGPRLNAEIFKKMIKQSYGEKSEVFLNLYPHQTDAEVRASFNKAWRDEMAWGAHMLAKSIQKPVVPTVISIISA